MTRKLTEADVEFSVGCFPEDRDPDDSFGFPEDAEYARTELANGNQWGWCQVRVLGRWGEFSAEDWLGGCSYPDEKAFTAANGYYKDMKGTVLRELNRQAREEGLLPPARFPAHPLCDGGLAVVTRGCVGWYDRRIVYRLAFGYKTMRTRQDGRPEWVVVEPTRTAAGRSADPKAWRWSRETYGTLHPTLARARWGAFVRYVLWAVPADLCDGSVFDAIQYWGRNGKVGDYMPWVAVADTLADRGWDGLSQLLGTRPVRERANPAGK